MDVIDQAIRNATARWAALARGSRMGGPMLPALMLALVGVTACNGLTDLKRPERARVELSGPDAFPMEVVISTKFFVIDQSLSFVTADTTMTELPVTNTYPLDVPARFYFMAANAGDKTEEFTLKVWIEEESWYDETKVLKPGEKFEFVYRYNEPGIR